MILLVLLVGGILIMMLQGICQNIQYNSEQKERDLRDKLRKTNIKCNEAHSWAPSVSGRGLMPEYYYCTKCGTADYERNS